MSRRSGLIIPIIIAVALSSSAFGQHIHLKTRNIVTGEGINPGPRTTGGARQVEWRHVQRVSGPLHEIVQFDYPPGPDELNRLMMSGAKIIAVVPDNAVVISAPANFQLTGDHVRWTNLLEGSDKLSPHLPTMGTTTAMVEFHSDVSSEMQEAILQEHALTATHMPGLMDRHVVVTASLEQLRALAGEDEVAYIFPADHILLNNETTIACPGMLTQAGPVAQYANIVHGWDLDSSHTARLEYVFGELTPKVAASVTQSEIVRAFEEWAKYANVVFSPGNDPNGPRTIFVRFAHGNHGDGYPFDGSGKVLAHTFYPVPINPESIAGDMHLDADENWHSGIDIDIYTVALHEAGHALGLAHSDNPGDVMYPYYRPGTQLSANDTGAVQQLYGAPDGGAPGLPSNLPVHDKEEPDPLNLTLDTVPPQTQTGQISISGMISGGTVPVTVQWQSNRGYGGKAVVTGSSWTAAGVTLGTGSNLLTITALDSQKRTATATASVVFQQPVSTPKVPIGVSIQSPAGAVINVRATIISISGSVKGGSGVTKVTWQTSAGASGTALGTDHWVASNIPLLVGTNTLMIRATDSSGSTGWTALVAVRR